MIVYKNNKKLRRNKDGVVFIGDTPRPSNCTSPWKGSLSRLPYIETSPSLNSWNYEPVESHDLLDCISEREWRLLATLARKREDDEVRNQLAEQFRKLWEKEKIENKIVEEEISGQYKRYLLEKRKQEEHQQELKNVERNAVQQLRRDLLLDTIKYKEVSSANRIAHVNDVKTNHMLHKALDGEARRLLANDRRHRLEAAQGLRKQVDLFRGLNKVDNARKKRSAILRDCSQRTAISNTLSSWESTLVRNELNAIDEARRAQYAAHAAWIDQRSAKLAQAREKSQRRARRIADLTQQLRDIVKNG